MKIFFIPKTLFLCPGTRKSKTEQFVFLNPTTIYWGSQLRKNEKHVVFLLKTLFLSSQHKSKKLGKKCFFDLYHAPPQGGGLLKSRIFGENRFLTLKTLFLIFGGRKSIFLKKCFFDPDANRHTNYFFSYDPPYSRGNNQHIENDFLEILPGLLPLLTHVTLRLPHGFVFNYPLGERLLKPVQTPVYIEHKMFNIYTTKSYHSNHTGENFDYYYPIRNRFYRGNNIKDVTQMKFVWSLPCRTFDNDPFSFTVTTAIHITDVFPISMNEYHLSDVQILRIDRINPSLFTWINTFIDLNKMIELNSPSLKNNSQFLFLLISQMKNLQRLSIDFNFFINNQLMQSNQSMKWLNISLIEHSFKGQNIHSCKSLSVY